jgi:replicative DNA helicase
MTSQDLSLKKLPPYNTEAERCVLGAVLLDNDSIIKTIGKIVPKDFYHTAHVEIFTVMTEMFNNNATIDLVTLSEALLVCGKLEIIGGSNYLMDLMEATPTATTIVEWSRIVKAKYTCI